MNVKLHAFEDRSGNFIFVKVPDEYGRYVRTAYSVALVDCPYCKSPAGVPCKGQYDRYTGSSHAYRHVAAKRMLMEMGVNINSACRNSEEHPVLREDILHTDEPAAAQPDDKSVVRTTVDLTGLFK